MIPLLGGSYDSLLGEITKMFLENTVNQNEQFGWIEVICGSMFSGKTQTNFSNSPFAIPMPSDVSSPTSTSIATLPVNNPASNSKLSPVYQGEKTEPTGNNSREYVIRSPRLAPSAVVSENIVLAKALLSENFSHNIAAVKRLYTSSQVNEMPRFKSTTDLIA